MNITVNKKQLIELFREVTGHSPNELKLIKAMCRYFSGPPHVLSEEKIKLLAGEGIEHFVRGVAAGDEADARQELIKNIQAGSTLTFKWQADNPYDPNAVGVFYDEQQIGFLPKEDAPFFKDIADIILGKVVRINQSVGSPYLGIRFRYVRKDNALPVLGINYDEIATEIESLDAIKLGRVRMGMREALERVSRAVENIKEESALIPPEAGLGGEEKEVSLSETEGSVPAPAEKNDSPEETIF